MYILTIYGKETDGAYSVKDDEGDQILYLFEEPIISEKKYPNFLHDEFQFR